MDDRSLGASAMTGVFKSEEGQALLRQAYARFLTQWPEPREVRRLPTSAGETAVIVSGAPDGAPVVLLHGAGSNSLTWMQEAAAFGSKFRVFAVDIPGEPGESAAVRLPFSGDAFARWLDEVLNGLGLPRASFVGRSLGGWASLSYAVERPERVARLVLLCPGGVGRVRPGFLVKAAFCLMMGRGGRARLLKMIGGAQVQGEAAAYLELIFTHFNPRRDALHLLADEKLKALSVPTLAILGAQDQLIDSADSARRFALAPGAEVVMVEDEGHVVLSQTDRAFRFLSAG